MSGLDAHNQALERDAPQLFRLLSPLGREAFFPPDIPFQAKEAAGTELNGTIGVFTDGHGNAMPFDSMAEVVRLDGEERNRAFLYSPVLGIPALRQAWAEWQRCGQIPVAAERPGASAVTSLPIVVGGLTHGLSLAADLFAGSGTPIVVGKPFWGNYRQIFHLRRGARVLEVPIYQDRRYSPAALIEAVAALPDDQPAMVVVNFPSNPGGYSPTVEERRVLRDGLVREADRRPLMVISDDAYSGLVFEDGIPTRSFFWDLVGAHDNLLPVKIDGATKEFAFFGGRVAFLTFGIGLSADARAAIENKCQCLIRATIGSPSALGQVVLHRTLESGQGENEVEEVRRVALQRYEAVQSVLPSLDPRLLQPLPFNSGFFLLMELGPDLDLDPHAVRRHLIEHHGTGIVASAPNLLRVALCSVDAGGLPEMLRRIEKGVRELAD